jgi:hypothetical protein
MKKLSIFLCIAAVFFCMPEAGNAILTNGGFEAGDFTGWTVTIPEEASALTEKGSVEVVTGHEDYYPVEGEYLGLLMAGIPDEYTTLSQQIYLTAGDVLSGWAAFEAGGEVTSVGVYDFYNDNAHVWITDKNGNVAVAWSADIVSVGNNADGPWERWKWTAGEEGTYSLEFGVANADHCLFDSYALFDANVHTTTSPISPVPEPTTLLLLGSGLIALAGLGRKKLCKRA